MNFLSKIVIGLTLTLPSSSIIGRFKVVIALVSTFYLSNDT
jgi:hypothetical protein